MQYETALKSGKFVLIAHGSMAETVQAKEIMGIVAFTYQGINYRTREKVVDLGPINMRAERFTTFPMMPVAGGALRSWAVLLCWSRARKNMIEVEE